jgi:hypothetical protein
MVRVTPYNNRIRVQRDGGNSGNEAWFSSFLLKKSRRSEHLRMICALPQLYSWLGSVVGIA